MNWFGLSPQNLLFKFLSFVLLVTIVQSSKSQLNDEELSLRRKIFVRYPPEKVLDSMHNFMVLTGRSGRRPLKNRKVMRMIAEELDLKPHLNANVYEKHLQTDELYEVNLNYILHAFQRTFRSFANACGLGIFEKEWQHWERLNAESGKVEFESQRTIKQKAEEEMLTSQTMEERASITSHIEKPTESVQGHSENQEITYKITNFPISITPQGTSSIVSHVFDSLNGNFHFTFKQLTPQDPQRPDIRIEFMRDGDGDDYLFKELPFGDHHCHTYCRIRSTLFINGDIWKTPVDQNEAPLYAILTSALHSTGIIDYVIRMKAQQASPVYSEQLYKRDTEKFRISNDEDYMREVTQALFQDYGTYGKHEVYYKILAYPHNLTPNQTDDEVAKVLTDKQSPLYAFKKVKNEHEREVDFMIKFLKPSDEEYVLFTMKNRKTFPCTDTSCRINNYIYIKDCIWKTSNQTGRKRGKLLYNVLADALDVMVENIETKKFLHYIQDGKKAKEQAEHIEIEVTEMENDTMTLRYKIQEYPSSVDPEIIDDIIRVAFDRFEDNYIVKFLPFRTNVTRGEPDIYINFSQMNDDRLYCETACQIMNTIFIRDRPLWKSKTRADRYQQHDILVRLINAVLGFVTSPENKDIPSDFFEMIASDENKRLRRAIYHEMTLDPAIKKLLMSESLKHDIFNMRPSYFATILNYIIRATPVITYKINEYPLPVISQDFADEIVAEAFYLWREQLPYNFKQLNSLDEQKADINIFFTKTDTLNLYCKAACRGTTIYINEATFWKINNSSYGNELYYAFVHSIGDHVRYIRNLAEKGERTPDEEIFAHMINTSIDARVKQEEHAEGTSVDEKTQNKKSGKSVFKYKISVYPMTLTGVETDATVAKAFEEWTKYLPVKFEQVHESSDESADVYFLFMEFFSGRPDHFCEIACSVKRLIYVRDLPFWKFDESDNGTQLKDTLVYLIGNVIENIKNETDDSLLSKSVLAQSETHSKVLAQEPQLVREPRLVDESENDVPHAHDVPKKQATYRLYNYPSGVERSTADAIVADAFSKWSRYIPVEFKQLKLDDDSAAEIEIVFLNFPDENSEDFLNCYREAKHYIYISDHQQWKVRDSEYGDPLHNVLLYAIGYTLGLPKMYNPEDSDCVMSGNMKYDHPQPKDITNVKMLFGPEYAYKVPGFEEKKM